MKSFNTKVSDDTYNIAFQTDDEKAYDIVLKVCRALIDDKPVEGIVNKDSARERDQWRDKAITERKLKDDFVSIANSVLKETERERDMWREVAFAATRDVKEAANRDDSTDCEYCQYVDCAAEEPPCLHCCTKGEKYDSMWEWRGMKEKTPSFLRHGHFVELPNYFMMCSQCQGLRLGSVDGMKYCPNCGAKMDEGDQNNEYIHDT